MFNKEELRQKIFDIDGRGYKSYKSIEGAYNFTNYILFIDHVQSDPFAPPSRLRVRVGQHRAGFPLELFKTRERRIALEDFITRQFGQAITEITKGNRGIGKSGLVAVDRCGQEVLERTSMVVNKEFVEARLVVGLPARGRSVLAKEAIAIFFEELPRIIEKSLIYESLNKIKLREHVELVEDQCYLRGQLAERGLVSFVGNGSILPRESGISDHPLLKDRVIPFQSPPELEISIELPNRGVVFGMGITRGITLIVGGGYHGKSTLLRAIERGVYNHIPGDGRELVITVEDAVKIRAEDGRSVEKTDISGFINNLPFGQDTREFTTENASGSTSQAANIVEALEIGTNLLLLDEDTSATNFMIRDGRMQQLVAKENEPITPFIDRVKELFENMGVSTILVVGGSGDYFAVSDRVIVMENYRPRDVTEQAKRIAGQNKDNRRVEIQSPYTEVTARSPQPKSFYLGDRDKVRVKSITEILYGKVLINLQYVEQLVDPGQTNAIAEIIRYGQKKYMDGQTSLKKIIEKVLFDIENEGLDIISPYKGQHPGDYALPRKYEIAAAVNRYRRLQIKQKE
ncbi:ABC-ATPase domain-containing protein [Desulfolucanica intricata]|uniref:ABC-ATPase domain-containing protein n=1 Tax=Desulfolucanica intricata TaxID=1285191 RepID=UPI000A9135BC|nr:ABC-ATPase domain-containing protein [Desulfolucanica intricata]